MLPKISFITVVRNDSEGLRTTLQNLAELPYPDKELIVIDGESTDGTINVISEFSHYITYFVSERDSGIYDAMNKGIKAATGRFLWFVNAGDTIKGVEKLKELFTTDNYLSDIYFGDTEIINEKGKLVGLRHKKPPLRLSVNSLKNGMVICHQSFIMRRSITPLYNTDYRFSADYLWMIECVRRAKSSTNVGVPLSVFALGGATTKHHKASLKERFKIMRENFGIHTTILYHLKFIFNGIFTKKYR